jgi:hypothetical protein
MLKMLLDPNGGNATAAVVAAAAAAALAAAVLLMITPGSNACPAGQDTASVCMRHIFGRAQHAVQLCRVFSLTAAAHNATIGFRLYVVSSSAEQQHVVNRTAAFTVSCVLLWQQQKLKIARAD